MFFYNNYVLIWQINEFFNIIVGYIKYDAILQSDQKSIRTMFVSFINLAKSYLWILNEEFGAV